MSHYGPPTYARSTALRPPSRFNPRTPSSQSTPRTEHQYSLNTSKGVPWITLKLSSKAKSSAHLPAFFEDEPISGIVLLNLDKEESIKSISVSVSGQMTSSTVDVYTFLESSVELWSSSMGSDPSSSPEGSSSRPSAKLKGYFQWPFTLAVPATVILNNASGRPETWRTPPSFSERMTRVHIQYTVTVHVRRGKFRLDTQLSTVVGFTPVICPPPFSEARRQAYLTNTPLVGPFVDIEGWHRLDPFLVRGVAFSSRMVDVLYTLYLAKPLSYTRGSVIPCYMLIQCNHQQALDLLSMPRTIDVRLVRHISSPMSASTTGTKMSSYGVEFETSSQYVQSAVWWPQSSSPSSEIYPDQRVLSGEIYLARDMKASCHVGKFELFYTVAVYPSKAVAFIPDDSAGDSSQIQKVDIVTAYGPGPRPRAFSPSPPNYDDSSSIGQSSEFSLFRGV